MSRTRTVEIPESVFLSAQTLDDIEDWLSAHNPELLSRLRRIRDDEDTAGKGKDLSEILQRWPTES